MQEDKIDAMCDIYLNHAGAIVLAKKRHHTQSNSCMQKAIEAKNYICVIAMVQ